MTRFQQATAGLAYVPRGVMFSEMYVFDAVCREQGVARLAESGVANGLSTRILRALGWALASFDKDGAVVPADLKASVTVADGRTAIPAWVEAHPADRLGILLDGPKGPKGAAIRDWCLTQPQVRVVAQHDSRRGSGETIHSRDPEWQDAVGLDVAIPADAPVRCSHGLGIWINREALP